MAPDGADGDPAKIKALAELDQLARLLDSNWTIPGTSIRFGVDAVAGLVPVVGDSAMALVSAYIILRARSHGASGALIARMAGNVAIDTVIGSIPLLGSIFDVYFKSNKRNVLLLRRHLEQRGKI
ncbi:DUF4112 domain-containing protein [Mesorhizobium sp. CAU 1732]|uniref:DUF4112 domain-containing protein n=1 Tax=Mesorhizobium sp. CAU 1732 TaxID=3140358 RepID=UPI003261506D